MCTQDCSLIQTFINKFSDPVFALINSAYKPHSKARYDYRKALKAGCEVKRMDKIDKSLHNEIVAIFESKKERQHREINYIYKLPNDSDHNLSQSWPHPEYIGQCDRHYFDFHGCFYQGKLVAYLELLHSNDLACVYSTMGHGDYLHLGIMKYLFIKTIEMSHFRYLQYGEYSYLSDERVHFMKQMGITQHWQKELLNQISTYDPS